MAYGTGRYVSDRGARPSVRTTAQRPPGAHRTPAPPRRVPGFDGLRVLAAAALAAYHAIGLVNPGRNPAAGVILPPAAFVFFLISGFVIYRPLVAGHLAGSPPPDAGRFWLERAGRVFPLWWAALATYLVVHGTSSLRGPLDATLTFGLLQFARTSSRFAVIGPAWALSVEWIFYLAAPVVALLTRRLQESVPTGLTATTAHVTVLAALGLTTLAVGTIRPFIGIVAGMAIGAFDAHRNQSGRAGPPPRLLRSGWPAAAVAFTITAAGWMVLARWHYGPGISVQWSQRDPALALLWLAIALAWFLPVTFAHPRALVSRVLGSATAHRLADLTFGIYLWHHLVLEQLLRRLGPDVGSLPVATLTILGGAAAAMATLPTIERPGRLLAGRLA